MLGVGNVALDVARVLAKTGDEMLTTDIPAHVYEGLKAKRATDVHVFARRGPAYAKFSPLELRELAHSPNVDVIVHPEGFEVDDGEHGAHREEQAGQDGARHPRQLGRSRARPASRTASTCTSSSSPSRSPATAPSRRCAPSAPGWSATAPSRAPARSPTGTCRPSTARWATAAPSVVGLPFDDRAAVIPNDGGRVLDLDGDRIPGTYVTGWIKRGPIGLIGHTKSDAAETVAHLVAETTPTATSREPAAVDALPRSSAASTSPTSSTGCASTSTRSRSASRTVATRVKVATREEMLAAGR